MTPIRMLLALGLALPGAAAAQQGPLPCYDDQPATVTIRWRPPEPLPPDAGDVSPITSYRLLRGFSPSIYDDHVDLPPATPDDDGVYSTASGGWDPTRTYFVALAALNAGGQSPPSNELTIPAVARRCPPPGRPELIDIIISVTARMTDGAQP